MKKKQINSLKPAAIIPVPKKSKNQWATVKKPWDHSTVSQFPLRATSVARRCYKLWEYFKAGSQDRGGPISGLSMQSNALKGFWIN